MYPEFTEAEIQVLIAVIELTQPIETPNNIGYSFYPKTLEQAAAYFRKSRVEWSEAIKNLKATQLLTEEDQSYQLSEQGAVYARQLRQERPPLWYWYQDFYKATASSPTHAIYCERLFGKNLCQDGFMEMGHLEHLINVLHLKPAMKVLDLGCGNGRIAEYISDTSGAHVWGMDYISEAIRQAQERTTAKRERLNFKVGNLDCIEYSAGSFDALISVDTLYMPTDLTDTVRQMKNILKPGGQMAIFYSHVLWGDDINLDTLRADQTPVGAALRSNQLTFQSYDYRQAAYDHAKRKKQLAEELSPAFEAEGNTFLTEVQLGESGGTIYAFEAGHFARYLYHVVLPGG